MKSSNKSDSELSFYAEKERLKDLLDYEILDTPYDEAMNSLTRLASQICDSKIAQINFIDDKRQWSKAMVGVDFREIPKEAGFCIHTIRNRQEMIIPDVSKDDRFKEMPFVKNEPKIRFYAGINIKSDRGLNIGTICVIDNKVKKLTEHQYESLKILASEVEARLELHRKNRFLKEKNKQLKQTVTFLYNSADIMFVVNPESELILDINKEVKRVLGYGRKEIIDKKFNDFFSDHKFLNEFDKWKISGRNQKFTSTCFFNSKSGNKIWLLVHVTEKNKTWYATARDITERKIAERKLIKSLHEKEVMLGEIHHRVKNNLAVISGLLQLESFSSENPEIVEVLKNNQSRIQAMALIHENLYQNEFFTDVPLKNVFPEMVKNFREKNQVSDDIKFKIQITDIKLNINQAIPLSLLLNELLFEATQIEKRESSLIEIGLTKQNNEMIVLSLVQDSLNKKSENNERRLSLIEILTQQLDGQFKSYSTKNKFRKELSFKKTDIKGSAASNNF